MTFHTDAIFEGGLLRPLEPLNLKEHEVVSLSISTPATTRAPQATEAARQRSIVMAHVAKVESRPSEPSNDGLTNRDHDRLIYDR